MTSTRANHALLILAALLLAAVWLKNAWVCDDAYINFRSLDQLRAGHGPVWNAGQRVQVYTSVLWYWLQAPLRLVSADVWANVLVLSAACMAGLVAVMRRLVGGGAALLLLALLMVGARGFMDFTSGGLENPLIFLACAVLLDRLLAAMAAAPADPAAAGPVRQLALTFGAALLVRHDLAVLWLPPVLHAAWRHRRLWPGRRWLSLAALAAAPLAAWTAFALFYYGSPWPNAALAKLSQGLPRAVSVAQGWHYLAALRLDPVFGSTIAGGLALAVARPAWRGLGAGMVANLAYLVWIGGDFMLGRMLGGVFLVAAVLLAREVAGRGPRAVAAGVAVALLAAALLPRSPVTSPRVMGDHTDLHGRLADERAYYFDATSLWARRADHQGWFPVHQWTRDGRRAGNGDVKVVVAHNAGFFGYHAGVDKMVVDVYAITDPLLARVPVTRVPPDWRPAHVKRPLPRGYVNSLKYGKNMLDDGRLRPLYDDVQLAVSAPLLAPGRAGAVWRLLRGVRR
jgi:arabinofuranosyltransferase